MAYKDLENVNSIIRNCTKCILHENRKNAVCGIGSLTPDVFLIGEAPGRSEDENGIPFSGRSGNLLRKSLANTGITEHGFYITNSVKCRPPNNVKPNKKSLEICNEYLKFEIELLRPSVIIPLGNTSLTALSLITGSKYGNISGIIGKKFEWKGTLILPQFHPAAVLRDMKRLEKFNNVFLEVTKILKN